MASGLPSPITPESCLLAALLLLLGTLGLLLAALRWAQDARPAKPQRSRRPADKATGAGDDRGDSEWLARIRVTEADVERIQSCPQRRAGGRPSAEWLRHRRHRLTASRFYRAVRAMAEDGLPCDAEDSCRQVIEEMLAQPEATSSCHSYGIANEPRARQSYTGFRRQEKDAASRPAFSVEETGLCVCLAEPWLAASPDGVVRDEGSVGALEIKCCREASRMFSVDNIPPQYYDQIQGEMAILSSALRQEVSWCDFFVWSPSRHRCRRVPFDKEYFYGCMLPKLRAFYFGWYVPIARRAPLGATGRALRNRVGELMREQHKRGRRIAAAAGAQEGR